MGRLIHQREFTTSGSYRFYKNNIASSFYFYKILNDDKPIVSGKLIAN